MRDSGERRVLKPAGVKLTEYSTEHWKYETVDPFPGDLYEYWLKFEQAGYVFYVPSFVCSLASLEPVSSVSEPEDTARMIQVKREQTPRESFTEYRGDSVRVRLTVTAANGVDPYVFGHQIRDTGPDFSFIASPFDHEVYPRDTPSVDQTPPFYLRNQIDVLVPTPGAADALYNNVLQELAVLVDAYNRHDTLSEASDARID